jgi:hypothetical protein
MHSVLLPIGGDTIKHDAPYHLDWLIVFSIHMVAQVNIIDAMDWDLKYSEQSLLFKEKKEAFLRYMMMFILPLFFYAAG